MDRNTQEEFELVWSSIDKVLIRFLGIEAQNKKVKNEIDKIVERLAKFSSDISMLGIEGGIHQELIFDILRSLSDMYPDKFSPHPMDEYIRGTLEETGESMNDTVKDFLKELPTKFEDPEEFKYLSEESDSATESEDDKK